MKLTYDDDADVLYVVFDESSKNCVYVDSPSGAILRIDEKTGKVMSATIPLFSRRAQHGDLEFPELAGVSLPSGFLKGLRI